MWWLVLLASIPLLVIVHAPVDAADVTVQGSVTLTPGFNAVGLPVNPTAVPDTHALLPYLGTAAQIDRLLAQDPTTHLFQVNAYDQLGNVIGTSVPVQVGKAWIVYAKLPVTLNYNVTVPCPQYVLDAGSHLLSFPFVGTQMTAYGLLQALGGPNVISSVQGFDPASGHFETVAYKNGAPTGPNFPINPALGYFVNLTAATVYDPVPVVNTLSPNPVTAGSPGFLLTLSGNNFVEASTVTAGNTVLSPVFVNPTQLTATVPGSVVANPGSVPVTVTSGAPGCGSSNPVSLFVQPQGGAPFITQFSPSNGPIGTPVTIEGFNFDAVPGNNQVAFNGTSAIIGSATTTSISTTLPLSATTGPITVKTQAGTATSADPFTVTPRGNFTLNAVPAQATALQGGQTSYALSVTGAGDFTGLVTLGVSGFPAGVSGTFGSPALTTGQTTTLTVAVASSVGVSTIPLTVTGSAQLDGLLLKSVLTRAGSWPDPFGMG